MEGRIDLAIDHTPTAPAKPANPFHVDFTAGAIGGAAGLLIGHPFDTVKVKMQNMPMPMPGQKPMYDGAMDVTRRTIAEQGIAKGLYRGMAVPMGTVALFNAILFATNGFMKSLVSSVTGREPAKFKIADFAVCGMGAGLAVSMVATPTELIKCRLQAPPVGIVYNGPMHVAKEVFNSRGLLGLYKGLVPTFGREIPGNMMYFAGYEGCKMAMVKDGQTTADLSRTQLLFAGGIAGLGFWGAVYPMDVIKTRIQTDADVNPRYRGTLHCARTMVATEGVKSLYRGAGPCLARAFPANAVCFLVYEVMSDVLK